jgi:hypothetical protein
MQVTISVLDFSFRNRHTLTNLSITNLPTTMISEEYPCLNRYPTK